MIYEERVSILRLYIFKPLNNSYGPRVNSGRGFSALREEAFNDHASPGITCITLVQFVLTNDCSKTLLQLNASSNHVC